jgi:hypothetical protein
MRVLTANDHFLFFGAGLVLPGGAFFIAPRMFARITLNRSNMRASHGSSAIRIMIAQAIRVSHVADGTEKPPPGNPMLNSWK